MSFYSCRFQDFHFIFDFHQFNVVRHGFICIYFAWSCWTSCICKCMSSIKLGTFSVILFLHFSTPFSFSFASWTIVICMLSHRWLRHVSFEISFLYPLNFIISSDLSSIHWLLRQLHFAFKFIQWIFKTSDTVFFSYKISIWIFL